MCNGPLHCGWVSSRWDLELVPTLDLSLSVVARLSVCRLVLGSCTCLPGVAMAVTGDAWLAFVACLPPLQDLAGRRRPSFQGPERRPLSASVWAVSAGSRRSVVNRGMPAGPHCPVRLVWIRLLAATTTITTTVVLMPVPSILHPPRSGNRSCAGAACASVPGGVTPRCTGSQRLDCWSFPSVFAQPTVRRAFNRSAQVGLEGQARSAPGPGCGTPICCLFPRGTEVGLAFGTTWSMGWRIRALPVAQR